MNINTYVVETVKDSCAWRRHNRCANINSIFITNTEILDHMLLSM